MSKKSAWNDEAANQQGIGYHRAANYERCVPNIVGRDDAGTVRSQAAQLADQKLQDKDGEGYALLLAMRSCPRPVL